MSLIYKDNRSAHLKALPAHFHHLPTTKQLNQKHKRLEQRAQAAQAEIENANELAEEGDLKHFELVNRRINSEKTMKKVEGKLQKLNKEIEYTKQVSRPYGRDYDGHKGTIKSKNLEFRLNVLMY